MSTHQSQRTRRVAAIGTIAITGLLFSLLFVAELSRNDLGQFNWIVSGYSLAFTLLLLASSEWLRRQSFSGTDLLHIAGWMLGWATPVAFTAWLVLLSQPTRGFWPVIIDIAHLAVIGAVAGVLTGTLLVRQRQMSDQLLHTQDRLQSVQDASPLPIVAVDDDGVITTWNPAAERTFGWAADEAIGSRLPPSDSVSGFDDLLARSQDERLVDGFEERRETKAGESIDVRTYFSPIYTGGDIAGGMAVIQDITDERRREEELTRSRNLLTWTERMADVGGWEWDLNSDTVAWTEGTRRIHGVGDEFTPTLQSVLEFYPPEHRATLETLIDRALEHGEPYAAELRLTTAQGSNRWVEVRGELVEKSNGGRYLRGAIRDISEEKEHEQRLMVLNRVLRHNLRNDLNVIQGRAQMLQEDLANLTLPQEFRESMDTAELVTTLSGLATTSEDLHTRISRFLEGVRLIGEFPVERAEGDARTIVAKSNALASLGEKARRVDRLISEDNGGSTEIVRVRELLDQLADRYHAEAPAASFEVVCEEDLRIAGNRDQLESALTELIENAIEHSDGDTPEVSLSATMCPNQRLELCVADCGPGLPRTELETLKRGEETPLVHGQGLGLWLVNWVVSRMDGSLSVAENDPTGTRVTMVVPASGPRATTAGDE
jgi:PAS domain S-box-containing protein